MIPGAHRVRAWLVGAFSALALALALALASCGPKVVNVCLPSVTNCPVGAPRATASPQAPREIKTIFGFSRPRSFGLPHGMDSPRSVALDPGGETLAVGSLWGQIILVDTASGKVRHRLGVQEELADGLRLAFTTDGRRLVSSGHGHSRVRMWDASTGKLIKEVDVGSFPIQAIAMGPRSEVALATVKGAEIWDMDQGQRIHLATMPYDLPVVGVAGSRTSLWAAGDRAGNVRLFGTGQQRAGGAITSPGQRITTVALAADGSVLASGFENGWVRLNNTASLADRPAFRFYTAGPPVGLRLHADGSRIVAAEASGKITHLSTARGEVLASHQAGPGGETLDFDLSQEGSLLTTVSSNRRVTLIQGAPDAPPLRLPPEADPPPLSRAEPTLQLLVPAHLELDLSDMNISSFALGRRGQFLAVAGHPTRAEQPARLKVYYLDFAPRGAGAPVARPLYERAAPPSGRRQKPQPLWVAITPDRKWLLAQGAGFSLTRWALISGRAIPSQRRDLPPLRGLLTCHDNSTVIGLAGSQVLAWSLAGTLRFRFAGLDQAYWLGAAPSPQRLVMIRGWDRMAAYDLPSGAQRWNHDSGPLPEYEVLAVALPAGTDRLVTYHANGFLRVRNLSDGEFLERHRIPTPSGTVRCALHPNGSVLACGHPGGVDLLEVPSGAHLGTLAPTDGSRRLRVQELAFSPKGNVLAVQTSRNQLAIYSFDHPGEVKRYTGVEAEARLRLGLPLVPSPVRQPPSALTAKPLRSPQGLLRPERHSGPEIQQPPPPTGPLSPHRHTTPDGSAPKP